MSNLKMKNFKYHYNSINNKIVSDKFSHMCTRPVHSKLKKKKSIAENIQLVLNKLRAISC